MLTIRSRTHEGGTIPSSDRQNQHQHQHKHQHQYYDGDNGNGNDCDERNNNDKRKTKKNGSSDVLSSYFRRFTIQWRLFKFRSKIVFALITLMILQHVVFGIWDQFFYQIGGVVGNDDNNNDDTTININSIIEKEHIYPSSSSSSSSISTFAVVINTYRRPERLRQTVQHYAETCGRRYNVGQVFVIWADQETEPPESGESFFSSSSDENKNNYNTYKNNNNNNNNDKLLLRGNNKNETISNRRVTVEVLQKSKDSLNARFEPIPQLQSTSVFMVDDDIRVACPSLLLAFQAWQQHPDSMVGYYPRLAAAPSSTSTSTLTLTTSNSILIGDRASGSISTSGQAQQQQQLVYHAWPIIYWRQKFNIVLTKASFLHSKYLELYTNDASFPKEIKDHVDRHMNCEDIAMSMLVANYTKHNNNNGDAKSSSSTKTKTTKKTTTSARPIYVEGQVSDVGLFGGISSGTGHFATRSDCLTQLTDIFRSKGWGSPLEDEFNLVASSWIRHAPGFWWQSGPSNIFEWLGLANCFS